MLEVQKIGSLQLCEKAVGDLGPAAEEYVKDAWHNKSQFAGRVIGEAVSALSFGAAVGSLLPKGPAGMIVGLVMTIPTVNSARSAVREAQAEASKPGADTNKIAHELASKTVSGTADFLVGSLAGYGGVEGGYRLSRGETAFGRAAQASQRGVLVADNEGISLIRRAVQSNAAMVPETEGVVTASSWKFVSRSLVGKDVPLARPVVASSGVEPEQMPFFQRRIATLARRADQYSAVKTNPAEATGAQPAFGTYRGTFHGHTKFDDGMGTAEENYANAKKGNLDFSFLTPHNHDGARQGVAPDDPRAAAEAGVPILAQTPAEYGDIINAARAASQPGQFYAGFGVEAGTIGPSGHPDGGGGHGGHGGSDGSHGGPDNGQGHDGHDHSDAPVTPQVSTLASATSPAETHTFVASDTAPTQTDGSINGASTETPSNIPKDPLEAARLTHHGGVNHINIFGITSSLIVADRQPHPNVIMTAISRLVGRDVPTPDIQHYPDGDYKSLANILGKTRDVTGRAPIVQFNHPRFWSNSQTDYGIASFDNLQQWRDQFVRPFVFLQEVVKGEALNSNPVVQTMKPGDFDPESFAGYIDMGVHAGPTYGRDSHFGDPGGRPAGTGLLASSLDENGVYDGMRNRRTFATTNYADLQGVLTANNESVYMGTVLDQAAVPDLNLKLKVGGNIDPNAQYQINLMADEQIGDGKVATPLKTVNMSGADLLKADQQVTFDTIHHKLGNQSAYYVEISRTAPNSTNPDRMLTAPIWVEPLSGGNHGLVTRALVGNGAQAIASPIISKF